jgi:hypothetical protein
MSGNFIHYLRLRSESETAEDMIHTSCMTLQAVTLLVARVSSPTTPEFGLSGAGTKVPGGDNARAY